VSTPRFLLAAAVSLAVVLSAPFIRDIRDAIRSVLPGQYGAVVAGAVALTIAAAVLTALLRIRDRRAARYGAIAAALLLGVSYAAWNAQGVAEVDAVERFHFVEYGLVTLLFYRAWRPVGDASLLVLPMLAGLVVGTAEEGLQWLIPGRIGDMRDIFLNGAAILCGLLFSLGLEPPDHTLFRLKPGSLRRIGVGAAVAALAFAAFVHVVHLGVEVVDREAGRFRSRYDAPALLAHAADRTVAWKARPPLERPASRSVEDQYQSEGHLHVRERNLQWEAGNYKSAWQENLILEKYYAPVLETPSYLAAAGHRWPDEQQADAFQRTGGSTGGGADYVSQADVAEGRHFIRLWPKPRFWTAVLFLVGAVVGVCLAVDRRS
jgi:hypothetical protein